MKKCARGGGLVRTRAFAGRLPANPGAGRSPPAEPRRGGVGRELATLIRRRPFPFVVVSVVAGAADHDLVLLDRDLDRTVTRPVLGVDRIVLDGRGRATGRSPPRRGRRSPRAARPCAGVLRRPPRRPRRRLALLLSSSSSSSSVLLFLLRRAARLGGFELGGDQRVVLGSQVDLVVEVDARAPRWSSGSAPGSSSCSRLNAWICWTVTSSWCAIHASVRPWRTQARIRFSSGRRDRRGIVRRGD